MAKERQMGKTLDDIRDDHKNRYREAIQFARLYRLETVLDIGAGVGYGGFMMAKSGLIVTTLERDEHAVNHARKFYSHPRVVHRLGELERLSFIVPYDLITCFEILEHTHSAGLFLRAQSHKARYLIGSVPNQLVVPYEPALHHYHVRHYTPKEIREFLGNNGWQVIKLGQQLGKHGPASVVEWGRYDTGRCILFCAEAAP